MVTRLVICVFLAVLALGAGASVQEYLDANRAGCVLGMVITYMIALFAFYNVARYL